MITEFISIYDDYDRAVEKASAVIASGGLVAFPTETVYGLGADAFCESAVKNIFSAKGRPQDNPLIVHIACSDDIEKLAVNIPDIAFSLAEAFWPGPFTMVLPKRHNVPYSVTGGLDTVAVRMPVNGFAHDLIVRSGCYIAAPSANLSGKPSPTNAQDVFDDMNGRIPLVIDGGSSEVGVESTVICFKDGMPVILRPGGITREMLEREAGQVSVHDAVLGELKDEKAASPGMKYKHYAPKAVVVVYTGSDNDIAKSINISYDNDNVNGVVFCENSVAYMYGDRRVMTLGNSDAEAASQLFAALRSADRQGFDKIYFHGVGCDGEGLAIMNRIIRAAGHNVISCNQEDK